MTYIRLYVLSFFGYINKGDNWISIWFAGIFVTLLDSDDDNGDDLIPSSVLAPTVVAEQDDDSDDDHDQQWWWTW